jgi:hypothetical protein
MKKTKIMKKVDLLRLLQFHYIVFFVTEDILSNLSHTYEHSNFMILTEKVLTDPS